MPYQRGFINWDSMLIVIFVLTIATKAIHLPSTPRRQAGCSRVLLIPYTSPTFDPINHFCQAIGYPSQHPSSQHGAFSSKTMSYIWSTRLNELKIGSSIPGRTNLWMSLPR